MPLHLTLGLAGHGFHPAAWQVSTLPDGPGRLPDYRGVVAAAEAAALDAVLFGPCPFGAEGIAPDPLPRLASLIARTSRIGLGGAVCLTHAEPFHVARAFAVLDNFSSGRCAMLADTVGADHAAADFAHAPRDAADRYPRAAELLDVVGQLWESWEPDAIKADKAAGHFANGPQVHRIDHAGRYFKVRGPLTAIRSPQGRPVLVQFDSSEAGLALAAETAELFLARCHSLAEAVRFTAALKAKARAAGREEGALRVLVEVMPILAATTAEAAARAKALDARAAPQPGAPLRCVGTPAECAALLLAWAEAGACDGFNILPAVLPDDAAIFCEQVVPILRAAGQFRAAYTGRMLREHLGLARPIGRFDAAGEVA